MIPLLERDHYVICASYDGFDETENMIFPTMLAETEKIEAYLLNNLDGHIHAAYGCSMGGSFVGLLVQRGRVSIDHAILGSSDLDLRNINPDWRHPPKGAVIPRTPIPGGLRTRRAPRWTALTRCLTAAASAICLRSWA